MTDSRSTNSVLADLLQSAPAWARVGLTAATQRARHEAIASLADHLAIGLAAARRENGTQLTLPL
ncbi:DUF6771 family protein [Novosphingobium gossypii]|uniref:DUF6771 family protein n=1 Tax=Novosphingobium gossypii TaxID=1604774 RepID=UPI003D214CE3